LDAVENDLKKMGVTRLEKILRDRDTWKLILKESKVLHGLLSEFDGGGGGV
jgi:hypothetical protein